MKKSLFLTLGLWLMINFTLFSQDVLINSSHQGPVNKLYYDDNRDLLFSSGEDGSVLIWDREKREILFRMQISHLPIKMFAVHPEKTQLAVVESDQLKTFRLSFWDWKKGTRLLLQDLDELPLFITYSPKGKYLLYARPEYNSLVLLNPETGRELNLLKDGSGIVSFAVISGNERNIMIYQPSGLITYLEISSGRILKRVKTLPGLAAIKIFPDNLFIAASTGESLVVVDLLNGTVKSRVAISEITAIGISGQGNEVASISREAGESRLTKWYFNRRELYSVSVPEIKAFANLNALTFAARYLFFGGREGSISYLNRQNQYEVLAENQLMEISSLAMAQNHLAVAGPENIFLFSAELLFANLLSGHSLVDRSFLREKRIINPFSGESGVEISDEGRLFLWAREDEHGGIISLDPDTGLQRTINLDFSSALLYFEAAPQGIITVEKSGMAQILDSDSYRKLFQYWAPGMNKLIYVGDRALLVAKSSVSELSSPLLMINQETGETVPIADTRLFVFELLYDRSRKRLFSLGIERDGDSYITQLKQHSGAGFKKMQLLYSYPGEDLSACMVLDDSALYVALNDKPLSQWNGYRFIELERSHHKPVKLFTQDRALLSLNSDSTLTLWDTRSRRIILNFYIFKDGEWAAFFRNGPIYTSSGGKKYLTDSTSRAPDYSGFF